MGLTSSPESFKSKAFSLAVAEGAAEEIHSQRGIQCVGDGGALHWGLGEGVTWQGAESGL